MSPTYKLVYFSLPGRGEVARLCAAIGNIKLEDERLAFPDWAKVKPTAPFGQAPILEVDGKVLAQSGAIDRFLAAKAGLIPSDAWLAAVSDMAYCYCQDLMMPLYETFRIKDLDEKIKARQEAVAGPLKEKLDILTKFIRDRLNPKSADLYIAGHELSLGDLNLFVTLSTMVSGWMDGVPKDLFKDYPIIKEYRDKIASHPEVKAFYEKAENQDDIRAAFKPDAAAVAA